ncbi:MAG: hypothetical protein M3Y33_19880 [Actinomycetota bacterium]|nr:hypothetical protein [Actinomycetota bacterium]
MTNHYTHEHDQEMADLYRAGRTTYEIAERFGVSPTPVARALRRQGVELRPSGRRSAWADTPQNRADIIAAYRGGEAIRKISGRLRIRPHTVIQVLDDGGVTRHHSGARPMFSDEIAADIESSYLAGAKLAEIAERHGTNHITIRNYLVRRGVPLRDVSAFWTDERRAEAASRYQAGASQQQIADAMGCHQTAASRALRHAGVLPRAPMPRGEKHASWKGGRRIVSGYVQVLLADEDRHLIKPMSNGYVLEHRLVMARHLGRPLLPDENVHHQRANDDNALEHLELWTSSQPSGRRVEEIVAWSAEMLRRYAPDQLSG